MTAKPLVVHKITTHSPTIIVHTTVVVHTTIAPRRLASLRHSFTTFPILHVHPIATHPTAITHAVVALKTVIISHIAMIVISVWVIAVTVVPIHSTPIMTIAPTAARKIISIAGVLTGRPRCTMSTVWIVPAESSVSIVLRMTVRSIRAAAVVIHRT